MNIGFHSRKSSVSKCLKSNVSILVKVYCSVIVLRLLQLKP